MATTETKFLKDVEKHVMEVIRDDGAHRHIRFRQPGTMCMHFDLITWPGYLCYTGDMGTYVFRRLHDMFEFFRRPEHCRYSIDKRYWAEKVEAGDRSATGNGVVEFSKERFDENARRWVADFCQCQLDLVDEGDGDCDELLSALADLRDAVEDQVIGADSNDVRCYDAAHEFRFGQDDSEAWRDYFGKQGFDFGDFWEVDHTEYTHRFEWCCFALSWAVQRYDEAAAHKQTNTKD